MTLPAEIVTAQPPVAAKSGPLFSVVIPTHESRGFVVAAIRSVLAQTDTDFEIIVVDNGSKDGTAESVVAIGDSRISYIWQEDSGLPGDSRNKGIEASSGQWIAFLDADDTWAPGKLARVRSVLTAYPGLCLIGHDVDVVNLEGKRKGSRTYRLDERPVWEQLLYRGEIFTTSAVCVRADVLTEAGAFDTRPEYFSAEGYDLWLRLAEHACRFAIIPEVLGTHLANPFGASSQLLNHFEALLRVYDDHCVAAARIGKLDVKAALSRRRRWRLAEVRDLTLRGAIGDAAQLLGRIDSEQSVVKRRYATAEGRAHS
jgi:glycosyltransferase involved in cell wall biosynthesis